MGVVGNKALVLRFYAEVWGRGNLAYAHEVFADNYLRHDLRPSNPPPGLFGAGDDRRRLPAGLS